MFNRTRTQLTVRNAAVLMLLLIVLNLSVYFVMKQMLFDQVDDSLTQTRDLTANAQGSMASGLTIRASALQEAGVLGEIQGTVASPLQNAMVFQIGQMDRPIIQLFWTEDDQALPFPGRSQFTDKQLEQLKPDKFADGPRSVKAGDQHFRVLNTTGSAFSAFVADEDGNRLTYIITKTQLLSNISAEIGMLNRLKSILLYGGLVGLLIAVAAGYYLANRALIPIRQSMDRQQQFVSDASHELRTPLSVIQAHTELLLRHPDHTVEQDSKHISTVLQETKRMSRLVSGLLMLARSDSNQLELDIKPVCFARIVADCIRKMEMLAEAKEILLHADIERAVPMEADEERLHQLLVIVLDNAIKYTPEGGLVRVVCRKLAHSAQLEVEDTGIGIAPEQLPNVFDRFYRGDKARNRQEGGTGLGLSIAKWIVEHHGGKIRIESKPAAGTRVFVTLPLG